MFSLLIDGDGARILSSFLLTLARVSGVVAFTPIPGFRQTPAAARVFLALVLAGILFDPVAAASAPSSRQQGGSLAAYDLLPAVFIESGIGICYGLATALVFEGFQLGCQIVGLQAGFSYASTLDPSSQADSTVLSVVVFLASSMLFLSTNLHHQVIRALAESLILHPPGTAHWNPSAVAAIVQFAGDLFRVGLRLAAPVSALMLTIDIGLALFSRMQPQLQIITLAFSVKILIALVVFSSVILSLSRLLHPVADSWIKVLRSIVT